MFARLVCFFCSCLVSMFDCCGSRSVVFATCVQACAVRTVVVGSNCNKCFIYSCVSTNANCTRCHSFRAKLFWLADQPARQDINGVSSEAKRQSECTVRSDSFLIGFLIYIYCREYAHRALCIGQNSGYSELTDSVQLWIRNMSRSNLTSIFVVSFCYFNLQQVGKHQTFIQFSTLFGCVCVCVLCASVPFLKCPRIHWSMLKWFSPITLLISSSFVSRRDRLLAHSTRGNVGKHSTINASRIENIPCDAVGTVGHRWSGKGEIFLRKTVSFHRKLDVMWWQHQCVFPFQSEHWIQPRLHQWEQKCCVAENRSIETDRITGAWLDR